MIARPFCSAWSRRCGQLTLSSRPSLTTTVTACVSAADRRHGSGIATLQGPASWSLHDRASNKSSTLSPASHSSAVKLEDGLLAASEVRACLHGAGRRRAPGAVGRAARRACVGQGRVRVRARDAAVPPWIAA